MMPRLEELLKRILVKDIDEPSANFIYETLLATNSRWDELEKHQLRRAERATDHGQKVEVLRMFGLEWVQRFKDRDRGAKFFDAALRVNTSNGEAPMRSVVAAFTLLLQVQGEKGEWQPLLDIADAVIAKAREQRGQAVRRDPGRPDRVRQAQRCRAREAVLRGRGGDRAAEPERAGLRRDRGSSRYRAARGRIDACDAGDAGGRRRSRRAPLPRTNPSRTDGQEVEEGAQGGRAGRACSGRGGGGRGGGSRAGGRAGRARSGRGGRGRER